MFQKITKILMSCWLILTCARVSVIAGNPIFEKINESDSRAVLEFIKSNDINAVYGDEGQTLLVYSIISSKVRISKLLIHNGADVNLYVSGKSPLMYAIESNTGSTIRQLLKKGARVNDLDPEKNSPLIYASRVGDLHVVKFLLRKGAGLNHKNIYYKNAFDQAVMAGNQEIAQYLRQFFAKNLPDYQDGPYAKWSGRHTLKAFYLVHDSIKQDTKKIKSTFHDDSDPLLMNGFAREPDRSYKISKSRPIKASEFSDIERIMVIGDIHGGYDSLVLFLKNNGVMDAKFNWTWKNGHLLFLGDIFDRGDKVTEALWLIYNLEDQADKSGGKVHYILGNHEQMIMQGDTRYISDKYYYLTDNLRLSYSGLFDKKTILGQWLRTKNSLIKINDRLFVHAGISSDLIKTGFSINRINELSRYFLSHPVRKKPEEEYRGLIMGMNGPFWYRGFIEENQGFNKVSDNELMEILDHFQVSSIFIGHSNVQEISTLYDNRVYCLDVPFYYPGYAMHGLLIEGDEIYLLSTKNNQTPF